VKYSLNLDIPKLVALVIGLVLLSSCERQQTASLYYNIDSLVNEQILYLTQTKAGLRKQGEINSVAQDTTFVPADSAAWARELDIFTEIGMVNKPINQGAYEVMDGLDDPSSNLTIRSFIANKELSVVYLKLFYLETPDKLRKIEALYQQENTLLKSNRNLVMEFTDMYNKSILTSYSIVGGQKMFVGDTVNFTITGTVHLN
jgi:hypothetical protein